MVKLAAIGECMIELAWRPGGQAQVGFGGDTLNTAVYLARLGVGVDYVTALGDDPMSEEMLAAWKAEGIGVARVARQPGRLPGLYLIRTGPEGERSFFYWREQAPAREIFDGPAGEILAAAIASYDWIYFSGITLSLYGDEARARLLAALARLRKNGGRVAFDSNYRPRGWPDVATARRWIGAAAALTDIDLSTYEDAKLLFADADPWASARRLLEAGVSEVAIKDGARACVLAGAGYAEEVPAEPVARVVDTTAAGDSFNAGYLASRLAGRPPVAAARAGHRLAGAVIQHQGAIIPAHAMPSVVPG